MGLIKRITATISSGMDQAITRVENHDAIVAAAIKDTQKTAAKAKVRLARVQRDGQALRRRVSDLEHAKSEWTRRAKACVQDDKEKALNCVRRLKLAEKQLIQASDNLSRHQDVETQVEQTLEKIQSRLEAMHQQRNMMRSRESVAEAMRVVSNLDGATQSDIEETFDRWEMLITESEIVSAHNEPHDQFVAEFVEAEDRALLEAELAALVDEDEDHDSQ